MFFNRTGVSYRYLEPLRRGNAVGAKRQTLRATHTHSPGFEYLGLLPARPLHAIAVSYLDMSNFILPLQDLGHVSNIPYIHNVLSPRNTVAINKESWKTEIN
jgi:hypothetical protein